MVALCVLGVCLAGGVAVLGDGLSVRSRREEQRRIWQAAAAWAQVGVLWQGGSTRVAYDSGSLSLSHEFGLCGGDLGDSAAAAHVHGTNVARWEAARGMAVAFGGVLLRLTAVVLSTSTIAAARTASSCVLRAD